ncbi:helix-turn-helix transcriptional regulator [Shewanella sp. BF02_Schw]|jgi:transcriptional regulator with XRE-family HTH domain|uniref:helix-turn-helix domain-containing protein n=1 Tax=Shewanella sp. BF02_Schw TaxID=394908 RepID=UPI0017824DD4|nr:helix-turn-helix transcriptional regulator [Shewanella sp. BF02_Schw]MBO1894207.1 helix-turn-helix transcriptional regulator [Shewanella sp. BF02_Schw]
MTTRGFEILKTGRRIRGLTQAEVAETYGVNSKTYQRWERGQTPVSYDDLAAICDQVFCIPLIEVQRAAVYAR